MPEGQQEEALPPAAAWGAGESLSPASEQSGSASVRAGPSDTASAVAGEGRTGRGERAEGGTGR